MVETTQGEFDIKLAEEWGKLAAAQPGTKEFLQQNTLKKIAGGAESGLDLGLFAVYNAK